MALLRRADAASLDLRWRGTQVVSSWSPFGVSSALLEVEHRPGRGSLVTDWPPVSAPPTGPLLVPDGTRAVQAARGAAATGAAPLRALEAHHVVRTAGTGRCAGREADVVEVLRRGAGPAPAARFWLDRETGLVLRRDTYDGSGRLTRTTALLDLQTGLDGRPAGTPDPVTPGGRVLDAATVAALRESGWRAPETLAGLDLHEVRASGEGRGRVVHLAYTDGLASLSVFGQRGRLEVDDADGWERRRVGGQDVWARGGLPLRVAWSHGGTVYTVLADAPPETLEAAVAALAPPPGSAGPGPLDRLRDRLARGLTRVADRVGRDG